jgi:thioredoxin 1
LIFGLNGVVPCKALAPILDEIADEYDGKITIAKVNVDENVQLPPKYGIRGYQLCFYLKMVQFRQLRLALYQKPI